MFVNGKLARAWQPESIKNGEAELEVQGGGAPLAAHTARGAAAGGTTAAYGYSGSEHAGGSMRRE